MATEPSIKSLLSQSVPATWEELRARCSELLPEGGEYTRGRDRTFRDRLLTPSEAGYVFEVCILDAFRLTEGCEVRGPFRVPMAPDDQGTKEEVDGLIIQGWQAFLVEAKFEAKPVEFEPIARLHVLVEQRPIGTLGLFFSARGYTQPALNQAMTLRPLRVLLFDLVELDWAIRNDQAMMRLVRMKWADAIEQGNPHLGKLKELAQEVRG